MYYALKWVSLESGMSKETGHGGLSRSPIHFCRTEDFSDVVWLEKAMVSFCKKMEEIIKDTRSLSSGVLNGID